MKTSSIRFTLGAMMGALLLYMMVVFGGLWTFTLVQTRNVLRSSEPLREELARLDRVQIHLDSLATMALGLSLMDTARAHGLATEVGDTPQEAMAVQAQRRAALPPDIRTALGRLAQPESELPARIRELTAAVETTDSLRYFRARERVLNARTELANATRRVELLALDNLAEREGRLQKQLRWAQYLLALSVIPVFVLLLAAYRELTGHLLAPLEELGEAVAAVQAGDMERELAPAGSVEMETLRSLFNEMTRSLKARSEQEASLRGSIVQELRRSEDLFRQVIQHASELILVMDADDGTILFASPSWKRLAGMPEAPSGRSFPELVGPESRQAVEESLERVRKGHGGAQRLDLELRAGGEGRFDFVFSPLEHNQVLAVGRDVTAVLEEEARLRRSSRLEAVGQLTGGVAHDFNNLLTVIRGNLDLLEKSIGKQVSPQDRELMENLGHAADRASGLTRSLLAFARRQTLREEKVDLSVALRSMTGLLNRVLTEEMKLEVTTPGAPLWVEVDPSQLESAVLNLVLNARDAMEREGTVSVAVREALLRSGDPLALELEADRCGVVQVTDQGTGMSPDTLARVFEPFFTTKEVGAGSGLGLSMVYGFVNQSGGTVKIDSAPGQGTRVSLFFPLTLDVPRGREEVESPPESPRGAGERILVVEDDRHVRRVVVHMLRDLGYETAEADEGPGALERIRAEPFSLVFSDVILPGGLDGAALGRAVREVRPGLPVLLTSGYPREALLDREGIEEVELLPKPYDRATLARAIRTALDSRPA